VNEIISSFRLERLIFRDYLNSDVYMMPINYLMMFMSTYFL
jgi:hypothetical protein